MNKPKSLSDSSTSESEDDFIKRKNSMSCEIWAGGKRTRSTDEEESQVELFYKVTGAGFKAPNKYSERRFSTDDTEDETPEMPRKKFNSGFPNPAHIKKEPSDVTDSESDEKNFGTSAAANMPSLDSLNGSYGMGMKLMERMGYKKGTGLGKYEQGRVEIVEASKQRGRRGLGLTLQGLEPSDTIWDSAQEEISIKEEVTWIPDCTVPPLSIAELREWMLEGKKKETIDDETEFCDPEILHKVLTYKSVFDELEPEEMRKARTRSNPFETIRGGIFLNRAAMKMANMDAAFDFMFTNPKTIDGKRAVDENELLYFADVCAGPGGFSEYVLWRKKWECKGFGFTLKASNDFKLEDFLAGPPETFEPHYGEEGDGDVYNPRNLLCFQEFVRNNTFGKGVHFMMADGGFSVEGRENEQEILSKRLYLCQFLCALMILRPGGHFVCKLFDLFTPFSVGLVYLMYMAFEKVSIFKPNTSRPANSERYIVCKWLKENTRDICHYMFEVNDFLDKHTTGVDITEVVPLHILKGNKDFYEYIYESNNVLGAKQVIHLDKIRVFAKNANLHDEKQSDLRKECLNAWGIPDEARAMPKKCEPDKKFKMLLQGETFSYLSSNPKTLAKEHLKGLDNVFDFHCVVCSETQNAPGLFIGLGKTNTYQYDAKTTKWKSLSQSNIQLELPADTIIFGELIQELKGESKAQRRITGLHIIDALFLGGKDVRNRHYEDRMKLAEKLARAVSKPTKTSYAPLRVKPVWQLTHIEDVFDRLSMKMMKNSHFPKLCIDLEDERHVVATGLLVFKTTLDPWITAFSKTNQRTYLFNTKKNISQFERVADSCANFKSCFTGRILWKWERGVRLIPEQNEEANPSAVHGDVIVQFVKSRLMKLTGRPCC